MLYPLIHDAVKVLESLSAHPRNNIVNTVNSERLSHSPTSFKLLKNFLNRTGALAFMQTKASGIKPALT